jgi:hypothetical protein
MAVRARWRVLYVHGLLVGDELDPSLDVGHLVRRICASIYVMDVLCRACNGDSAQMRGGYARLLGGGSWWLCSCRVVAVVAGHGR